MIPRDVQSQVEEGLCIQAAVALIGPRQAGKTTLALAIGETRQALYLDFENPADRAKLSDPALFLDSFEDRLVILDEIHRMPDLFQVLRGVIDRGRRRGKGTGRFLLLGSASLDLLRQSGESLAGRIRHVTLTPFTTLEVGQDQPERDRLWVRGGFPESFLAADDGDRLLWRKDFIRTCLERDVPALGPRIPTQALERLWTMLAHAQGSLLNLSALARALEISGQTVGRYCDLLADLLLLRRPQPYHATVGKRLVKAPKKYVRDSGLLHALRGIETLEHLAGHPVAGLDAIGLLDLMLLLAPSAS